jgi:hypothetical protein
MTQIHLTLRLTPSQIIVVEPLHLRTRTSADTPVREPQRISLKYQARFARQLMVEESGGSYSAVYYLKESMDFIVYAVNISVCVPPIHLFCLSRSLA